MRKPIMPKEEIFHPLKENQWSISDERANQEYLKLVRKAMPKTKHFSTLLGGFSCGREYMA